MSLEGHRVLLVEDELIIAHGIAREISEARTIVGPAPTLPLAMMLAGAARPACAVLDFRLGRDNSLPSPTSWTRMACHLSSTRAAAYPFWPERGQAFRLFRSPLFPASWCAHCYPGYKISRIAGHAARNKMVALTTDCLALVNWQSGGECF